MRNRDILLADLEEYIRNQKIKINSKRTLNELMTFIMDEKGKLIADVSCYDDLVMALAVSIYAYNKIREASPSRYMERLKKPQSNYLKIDDISDFNVRNAFGDISKEDMKWLMS